MLIYFGFTRCPDICPTELEKMHDAMLELQNVPSVYGKVQPIFITVDPHRDTVEVIKEYGEEFEIPGLICLTGTKEQVEQVSKAYRVFSSRSDDGVDTEDYLIDHSIFTYLMGPDGQFRHIFGQNTDAPVMASRIVNTVLVESSQSESEDD
eukprot:TRINITY_DN2889_c0_g1_i4.p1 TRINITY_DN2889_c0_g1~~TRINITY_DN2889_c0_g1_i4.p1  ORF type:complete len:151 (+),score=38.66 TRINITY_DN2889_c0_g1_i4:264-716(+)